MTAQFHEDLILDGEQTSMASCPPVPEDNTRIVRIETGWECSGCWRGYVGTWEIRDDRLYLVSLSGKYLIVGPGPIAADWVTGVLRVPRGPMLRYVHLGFESLYEQELLIEISAGRVTGRRLVDHRKKNPSSTPRSRLERLLFDDGDPDL